MSNTSNMQGNSTDKDETPNMNSNNLDDLGNAEDTDEKSQYVECDILSFPDNKKLKLHKEANHSNKNKQDPTSKDESQLEPHIENHKVKEEKKDDESDGTDEEYFEFFECDICYLSFPSNKHLEEHKKEHSLGSSLMKEEAVEPGKSSDSDEEYVPPGSLKNLKATGSGADGVTSTSQKRLRGRKEKFRCEFCALKFTDQKLLIEHSKEHYIGKDSPPKPYKSTARRRKSQKPPRIKMRDQLCCDICSLPCSSDEKLVEHLKAVHGDNSNDDKKKKQGKAFVCEICKASFSENHQLGEHFREHFKERAKNNTSKEEAKETDSENKCVCKTCGMGFPDFKGLATHLKSHVARQTKPRKEPEGEAFICEICDAAFAKKPYLQKHMRIHLADKPKCELCGVQCSNKSNLVTHMMIHTGEKPYKCDICEVAYSKRCNLIKHQSIHTGEKAFKCHFCEAGFSNRSHMLAHVRLHTGETPYKCDLCDQSFITQPLLAKHQRQHTGERPFKCTICGAAFIQKSSLTYHMKRGIHEGEHPHKCWFCDLELSSESRLAKHVKTHTEEKPYKCDSCLAEFSLKCTLNAHQKIHTGEKRFKCDKCDATFAKRGSLTLHQRVHTEMQYKCHICDASYFQKGSFDMHMKLHSSSTFDDAIGVYEKDILRSIETGNDTGKSNVKENANYQDVAIKVEQGIHSVNEESMIETKVERETNEMYECHICDASFPSKGALGRHMKLHSSNDFDDSLGISEKDILQSMELDGKSGSNGKLFDKEPANLTEDENKGAEIKVEPEIQSNEDHEINDYADQIDMGAVLGRKRQNPYNENNFSQPFKRQKDFHHDIDSDKDSGIERGLGLKIPTKLADSDQIDEVDGKINNDEKDKFEAAAFLAEMSLGIVPGQISRNHSSGQRNAANTFDYNTSLVEQIASHQDNSRTINKNEKDLLDQASKSVDLKRLNQDIIKNTGYPINDQMNEQAVDLSKTSTSSKAQSMNSQENTYNELLQNVQLPYINYAAELFEKAMTNPQMMGHASQPNPYNNQLAYMEYMQRLSASLLSNTAMSNNYQGASGTSNNTNKDRQQRSSKD